MVQRFGSKKITENSEPTNLSYKGKVVDLDSGVGFEMSQTQPVTSKESSKVPCVDLTENLINSVKGKSDPRLARQKSDKHYGKSTTNLTLKKNDKLCSSPNIIYEKDSNMSVADSDRDNWVRRTISKLAYEIPIKASSISVLTPSEDLSGTGNGGIDNAREQSTSSLTNQRNFKTQKANILMGLQSSVT